MYSPVWFYGNDIIIDIISIIVLLTIAFFSFKYYNINKSKKNYFLFGVSFIMMAVAFLFKIVSNFSLYYVASEVRQIGFLIIQYSALRETDILFMVGFLGYRIIMLLGLYLLYVIYHERFSKINFVFFAYIISFFMYFSRDVNLMFHFTAFFLLVLITKEVYNRYKRTKYKRTKNVFISFGLLTLSHLIELFLNFSSLTYVFSEVMQLLGFIILMVTFYKVLFDGKKT